MTKTAPPTPYKLTRQDLASITDVEMAFSTTRLLAPRDAIPADFARGNTFTALAQAIFFDAPLPDCEMVFLPGFDDEAAPGDLNRCVRAHLASRTPSHQHKMSAVGLMIASVCELRPVIGGVQAPP